MSRNLGNKIKEIRTKANLSQTRFGYKLGISGKTISAYETGKIEPPLRILETISVEYGENLIQPPEQHKNSLQSKIETIESSLREIKAIMGIYD